ncbi:MAG: prephenate dehydrogenase/arogenate dehydrogenase family protein [Acidobacteria bacterium]|nr:prephenate dehydrogenase/arogenate dehydrogenase family protein [Acidobacteriota bacterium]
MAIETVSIVGVGLIGGSFGLALRAAGFTGRIIGVSSPRTIEAALRRGAIDKGGPLEEAIPESDLVYLAQPISRILEVLPEVSRLARAGALVTDAGSTKREILERAGGCFAEGPFFVGGHPMAGKEQRGVERAEADLFAAATYVLCPLGSDLPVTPIVDEFVSWIGKIGAHVVLLPAEVHDKVVSWTSHLPQLLSTTLAASVGKQVAGEDLLRVAGPGLRDMTRLAESPYEMWKDILATNRGAVEQALDRYIADLQALRSDLGSDEVEQKFRSAGQVRLALTTKP